MAVESAKLMEGRRERLGRVTEMASVAAKTISSYRGHTVEHVGLKWARLASFFEVRNFFHDAYFRRMLLRISVAKEVE